MRKTCSECGIEQQLSEFNKNKHSCDGHQVRCRSCFSKYNKQRYLLKGEHIRSVVREYRINNLTAVNDGKKRYYAENTESIKQKSKNYYEKNKERCYAVWAKWREENRDRVNALSRKWNIENKALRKIISAKYNGKRRTVLRQGNVSSEIVDLLHEEQNGKCPGCLVDLVAEETHLDHFMPLSLGGLHDDSNIQLLCASCNLRKSAKHPLKWMEEFQMPVIKS